MANDDYYLIVFKVLTYLYAVMKRRIVFNYLPENKKMNRIKSFLIENVDTIASLIQQLF